MEYIVNLPEDLLVEFATQVVGKKIENNVVGFSLDGNIKIIVTINEDQKKEFTALKKWVSANPEVEMQEVFTVFKTKELAVPADLLGEFMQELCDRDLKGSLVSKNKGDEFVVSVAYNETQKSELKDLSNWLSEIQAADVDDSPESEDFPDDDDDDEILEEEFEDDEK